VVDVDYYSTFNGANEGINEIARELGTIDQDQLEDVARRQRMNEFPCVYPWHSVSVTWEGKVVPCCRDVDEAVILGDLRKDPLEKIWNDEPIRQLRREFVSSKIVNPLCVNCTENSYEIGLPKHYPAISVIKLRELLGRGAQPAPTA
jgi:radical SAM protein with 4Fe4S-binding SPASM domain